jgi:hypothetical protein
LLLHPLVLLFRIVAAGAHVMLLVLWTIHHLAIFGQQHSDDAIITSSSQLHAILAPATATGG